MSEPAIERATTLDWAEWRELFRANDAGKLPHSEIAALALRHMPDGVENPEWWAQSVAIRFEQEAGLRVPGMASDGTFHVSVSRTLDLTREAAIERWQELVADQHEHRGHACSNQRRSSTEKRSFWRATLEGAGTVEISATPKDNERVTFTARHHALPSGEELEDWRAYWKALIARV